MQGIDSATKGIADLATEADQAAGRLREQANSLTEATRLLSAGRGTAGAPRGAGWPGAQALSMPSTSSSIFFASPNSIRLFSLKNSGLSTPA